MLEEERASHRRRIARAVTGLRESRGLSRRELAEASGLSYPYVSQIENGDREPSIKALAALAGALGVELAELTTGADPWTTARTLVVTAPGAPTFANPDYRAGEVPAAEESSTGKPGRRRASRPTDVDAAVAQAHRALSLLTPDQRLEAVTRLLQVVVPEVVDEQVRARRW